MSTSPLPLTLFGLLLLIPSCRHTPTHTPEHVHSHEEAVPVSELPQQEFSKFTSRHSRH